MRIVNEPKEIDGLRVIQDPYEMEKALKKILNNYSLIFLTKQKINR